MNKLDCDHFRCALNEFFLKENIELSQKINEELYDLMPKLLVYEEESEKIKTNIIIGNGLLNYFEFVPNKYSILTCEGIGAEVNLRKQFKSLAPFCKNGWYVFIDYNQNDEIKLGIIKVFSGPLGLSIKEVLIDGNEDSDVNFTLCETVNKHELQFWGLKGGNLNLDFRLVSGKKIDIEQPLKDLAECIVSGIIDHQEYDLDKVFYKLFCTAYSKVHGAICLVVHDRYLKGNPKTCDGVWLKEPISLADYAKQLVSDMGNIQITTSETYYALTGVLIEMMNTDGITIINNKGELLAYNVFVKPDKSSETISGGARKRAAYYLMNCADADMIGVYFQSQDGDVTYERVNKNE